MPTNKVYRVTIKHQEYRKGANYARPTREELILDPPRVEPPSTDSSPNWWEMEHILSLTGSTDPISGGQVRVCMFVMILGAVVLATRRADVISRDLLINASAPRGIESGCKKDMITLSNSIMTTRGYQSGIFASESAAKVKQSCLFSRYHPTEQSRETRQALAAAILYGRSENEILREAVRSMRRTVAVSNGPPNAEKRCWWLERLFGASFLPGLGVRLNQTDSESARQLWWDHRRQVLGQALSLASHDGRGGVLLRAMVAQEGLIEATWDLMNEASRDTVVGIEEASSATSGNASMSNATSGNASMGNATSGIASMSNATSGNASMGNATSGNASMSNATSGNASMGNATSGGVSVVAEIKKSVLANGTAFLGELAGLSGRGPRRKLWEVLGPVRVAKLVGWAVGAWQREREDNLTRNGTSPEAGTTRNGTSPEAGTTRNGTSNEAGTTRNGTSPEAGTTRNGTSPEAGTTRNGTSNEAGTTRNGTSNEAGTTRNGTSPEAGTTRNGTSPEAGTTRNGTSPEAGTTRNGTSNEAGSRLQGALMSLLNLVRTETCRRDWPPGDEYASMADSTRRAMQEAGAREHVEVLLLARSATVRSTAKQVLASIDGPDGCTD